MESIKFKCSNCDHSSSLTSDFIYEKVKIKITITSLNKIYYKFICSKCFGRNPNIYTDLDEIIFDANDLELCSICEFPISNFRRRATDDKTNVCSASCIEEINLKEKSVHLDAAPGMPDGEKAICPKCGGRLEVRNGTTGWFLGCMNYPKCRGTRQL